MALLKRSALLFMIFFFLFAGVSCKTKKHYTIENYNEEHYIKGVEYAATGDFIEARNEFKESLKIDPNSGPSINSLELIEKSIDSKIKKEKVVYFFRYIHYALGIDFASEGEFIAARDEFIRALKIVPNHGGSTYSLEITEDAINLKVKKEAAMHIFNGVNFVDKGRLDKAITEFTLAIEIDPNYPKAHNKRGLANDNSAHYELAIDDFTKAIELDPDYTFPYINRGGTYASLGQI